MLRHTKSQLIKQIEACIQYETILQFQVKIRSLSNANNARLQPADKLFEVTEYISDLSLITVVDITEGLPVIRCTLNQISLMMIKLLRWPVDQSVWDHFQLQRKDEYSFQYSSSQLLCNFSLLVSRGNNTNYNPDHEQWYDANEWIDFN